jgi:hypothetical protein
MKKILFASIFTLMLFGLSYIALAQSILPGTQDLAAPCDCGNASYDAAIDDACKQYCGKYKLDDFMLIAIKVSNIILGLVGALAFAAFVIGGFMMMISRGNKNLLDKGTATLKNAVIGLIIVLSAYAIIQFTFKIFNINWKGDTTPPAATPPPTSTPPAT